MMTLCEFFDCHPQAPVARSLATLRAHLNRQIAALPPADYSPWTMRLGKGGPKADGGYYAGMEQSLYRHCMEVAMFAAWLCYHSFRAGRVPLRREDDLTAALQTLFAIAFAHDADKLLGSRSHSPSQEEIAVVYADLGMAEWAGLSVAELHHAVSLVENRGVGQALFGSAPLARLPAKLAEYVGQGDNFMSRVARAGGTAQAFVETYNADIARLHELYAVPRQPWRLIRFHHHPIVLHRFQEFLGYRFLLCDFYPLLFVRSGQWLELGVSERIDFDDWLNCFEADLVDNTPDFKVAGTTGTVTRFNIHKASDAVDAVSNDPRQAALLLRVRADDWETVEPLLKFWVMQCGAPFSAVAKQGKFCRTLKADGQIPAAHPFNRAAALVIAEVDRDATNRLLSAQNRIIDTSLRENGIPPEKLDPLTLSTVAALQASLLIDADALPQLLDETHGPWPLPECDDPGARAIVQRLRAQSGASADSSEQNAPYEQPPRGGACLLCGTPTEQVIQTGRMKLAGIKASSFANRIGHEKSLWSERGKNYLCSACVRIQTLLLEEHDSLRSTPILVATPVRHLLDPHSGDRQQNVLRSWDVFKDNWKKLLPWESDARFDAPLLFEERPTSLRESIDHMHRLARYAALSGEPVHAFITNQRACRAAFLYEATPQLIQELLADIVDQEGAISRHNLAKLLFRLELFKEMLAENEGMNALHAMPRFGWWAVAFVAARATAAKRSNSRLGKSDKFIERARQEHPMNAYDKWLDTLISRAVEIHRPNSKASGAEWMLMLRTALETYQKHYTFGATHTRNAIMRQLRKDLSRRYQDKLYQSGLDQRLHQFAEAAYELLERADKEFELESGFIRFLLAAYEGGYRQAVNEYWADKKSATPTEPATTPST